MRLLPIAYPVHARCWRHTFVAMTRQGVHSLASVAPACTSKLLIAYCRYMQAAHDCNHTEAELQTHRDDFQRFWNRRRVTFKRWDKAFKVLHTELSSLRRQMKAFLDTNSVEH